MAEIALPVLGLGALYLLSNKESNKKENYENMEKKIIHYQIQIFKILIILCHREKFKLHQ